MRRINRALILAIAAAIIVAVQGCYGRHAEGTLRRAEAVMEEHPDSALSLLRLIDGTRLGGERRARHALLMAQALDKNCIDTPADSIADVALRYYRDNGDYPRRRMMAFYYKAVSRHNAGDFNEAIYNLYIADTLAAKQGETRFRVLTNGLLALSYFRVMDLSHEIESALRALDACRSAADTVHLPDAMLYAASCYTQFGLYDEAYSLITQPECTQSPYILTKCYAGMKRYDDYRIMLRRYPGLCKEVKLQSLYARKLLDDGRVAEAAAVIDSVGSHFTEESDSIHWANAQRLRLCATGRYKEAYDMLSGVLKDEVRTYNEQLAYYQHSSRLRANDYIAASVIEMEREKFTRTRAILIMATVAALIIALLATIIYLSAKNRRQRLELHIMRLGRSNDELRLNRDRQAAAYRKLRSEKEAFQRRTEELNRLINDSRSTEELTDEQYVSHITERIDELARQYVRLPSNGEASKLRLAIASKIRRLADREFDARLDSLINLRHDNLMLKAAEAGFGKNELTLLRYLAGGIERRQIELLLDVEPGALSSRKSRLKSKLLRCGLVKAPGLI